MARTAYSDRLATMPDVAFVATRGTPAIVESYARHKVQRLVRLAPGPVLNAGVRLTRAAAPHVERRWAAQGTLDVGGRLVRAHTTAHDALEAIDELYQRLHDQLVRLGERRSARRRGGRDLASVPRRRGSRPRLDDAEPAEERVLRRSTLSPCPSTVDEAVFDLGMLDADFLLFRELGAGADAVVHHRDDGRLGLIRFGPPPADPGPIADEVAADLVLEPPPSTLDLGAAVERLRLGHEPFVAVRDPGTGRALVVHRRWDGHYGAVTPVDDPALPAEPSTARRRLAGELARLEAVRRALWAEGLDVMTEAQDVAELSAVDQHPADLGTETFERERDLSLLHEVDAEIDAVQRALVRLAQGTYGRCDACGGTIPDDRLVAVPAARFCVAHQWQAEGRGSLRV
jgi:RNA polymerase-binding transcription factor DksA/ribosome-associated translation inhibitor RaiA